MCASLDTAFSCRTRPCWGAHKCSYMYSHTHTHTNKEGKEIVFMEPLLCARHPAGDSWAWPGQHIHRFPAAKRASPLCGPALVSPCLTDSVLKSPSLAFSAPVLAPLLDLHSNRRLSQNHRILLSHIFLSTLHLHDPLGPVSFLDLIKGYGLWSYVTGLPPEGLQRW